MVLVADVLYIGEIFPVLRISSCHLLLVICASVQYVQSSWCAMCC